RRPGAAARSRRRRRNADGAGAHRHGRGLAPVARLRRHPPVAQRITEDPRMNITYTTIDSPIGPLLLAASDDGLRTIEFDAARHPVKREADWIDGDHPLLQRARQQLGEYFAGKRRSFDLPLDPRGTDFQRMTWQALTTIPYGQTISYAELASRVQRPKAMRAVGSANGRNPLPIVVPCHR